MRTSPVQLLQVILDHVRVELDPKHIPENIPNPLTSVFTFDGVSIQTEFGIAEADPDHERGHVYFVSLRVVVDNEPDTSAADQKFSPYRIDVAAEGLVLVLKGAGNSDELSDLASVNGAVILWSVIREQVLNITSRMRAGPVTLPTVHFHDLKAGGTLSPAIESADSGPA